MQPQLQPRLVLARNIAREAGKHTLNYFQQKDLRVEVKKDLSPVTIADREAEQLLRKQIAAHFPGDGILGEEFGEQAGDSGFRWILDPIDGTKSFIHGVPLYAVLIGVEHEEESRIGVIYIPPLEEELYAAKGAGAWHVRGTRRPERAGVSKRAKLSEGLFCTSDPANFNERKAWPFYERLCRSARVARTWGDAYGYLLVATGRAEVMVDPVMSVWDAAALLPILEESGGTYTNWNGERRIDGGDGLATNGLVLEEVLEIAKLP